MSSFECGTVLFNDPHLHNSGWAGYPDSEPEWIDGTSKLTHTDIVWITNLDYTLMFETGLSGQARFRQGNYLGWDYDLILNRIGLPRPQTEAKHETAERADALAKIFDRVARLSAATGIEDGLPPRTLAHGFRTLWFDDDPILPPPLVEAVKEATVYMVKVERSGGWPEEEARLWLPPVSHASRVVSLPVPWARWRHLRRSELPGKDGVDEWARACGDRPVLVKIRVEEFDPQMGPIINFGSGVMRSKRRRHVFAQELVGIAPFARVKITDAWECTHPVKAPAHEILNHFPDAADISISCALYAGTLWRALEKAAKPPPHKLREREAINPAMAWVTAIDRLYCRLIAMALARDGIDVLRYGRGEIVVGVDGNAKQIAEAATRLGLLVPSSIGKHLPAGQDLKKTLNLNRLLITERRHRDLMKADAQIVELILNKELS